MYEGQRVNHQRIAFLSEEALRYNVRLLRQYKPHKSIMVCLKADAYGHGWSWVASVLANDVQGFSVAELDVAIALKQVYPTHHVLLLSTWLNDEILAQCHRHGIEVAHYHKAHLSRDQGQPVWLKFDTGMRRLGFSVDDAKDVFQKVKDYNYQNVILMTHMACAGVPDDPMNEMQIKSFEKICALADGMDITYTTSISNSHGVGHLSLDDDWLRPGLLIYGGAVGALEAKPVMRVCARVMAVQSYAPGDRVGYDGVWQAGNTGQLATVGFGYADGYPRMLQGVAHVIHCQKSYPIVGHISMDSLSVDMGQADVEVGEWIELWGPQMTVDQLAKDTKVLPYLFWVHLGQRVVRQVVGSHQMMGLFFKEASLSLNIS